MKRALVVLACILVTLNGCASGGGYHPPPVKPPTPPVTPPITIEPHPGATCAAVICEAGNHCEEPGKCVSDCRATIADLDQDPNGEPFRFDFKPHRQTQLDLTVLAGREGIVEKLSYTGNCGPGTNYGKYCPLEQDKGLGPCAGALWGTALFEVVPDSGDAKILKNYNGNSNTIKVTSGTGLLRVCGSLRGEDAKSCFSVRIQADYPACPKTTGPPEDLKCVKE